MSIDEEKLRSIRVLAESTLATKLGSQKFSSELRLLSIWTYLFPNTTFDRERCEKIVADIALNSKLESKLLSEKRIRGAKLKVDERQKANEKEFFKYFKPVVAYSDVNVNYDGNKRAMLTSANRVSKTFKWNEKIICRSLRDGHETGRLEVTPRELYERDIEFLHNYPDSRENLRAFQDELNRDYLHDKPIREFLCWISSAMGTNYRCIIEVTLKRK